MPVREDSVKLVARRKREQNRAALDPWTVVHFASGLAAGLVDVPRSAALGAAVGYEVAEQYAERTEWGRELFDTPAPESAANMVVDVTVFLVGHRLGELWNRTGR